ncbi:MAG TPA: hypothetical protein PLT61_06995 [Acinetobacter johnsonii]|nr:hypothetical protein [Acinetobacter johnsonii]
MSLNLSERQQQVLQCVKDAKAENKLPYTAGVVNRMQKKGHAITEKQCAYDLGVIIRTKGTGVLSFKADSARTVWIYEEKRAQEADQ